MEYEINFLNMCTELADGHYKANVIYTFTISNGLVNTHGDVALTYGGVEIIEQRGKDPKTPEEASELPHSPFVRPTGKE